MREREDEWTGLMRSAISGDSAAYHRLLKAITPVLRAAARRGLARAGQPVDQSEDIVQEILLAVHLKRHTWDANAPFAPWLFAIARNKLIDALRRRGRRIFVSIDDFAETLPDQPAAETASPTRSRRPAQLLAGAPARRAAIDRGRERLDQGHREEIRDERGRGACRPASGAREPHRETEGTMSMDTDQLIKTLAADNAHRPRPVGLVLALALLAAAPVSILMFVAELGVRPDVMTAMHNPFFDLKFAVTLALAAAAIAVSLHLSRPEASLRGFVWLLAIPAGLLVAGISGEMMMPQRLPMMTRLVGNNSKVCMTAVPLMSLPLLAAALIGLRHGAPTRPALEGAMAGLLSAGLAATLYASHCTDNSPLFVATWYTLGAALVTAIGALVGSRVLRF